MEKYMDKDVCSQFIAHDLAVTRPRRGGDSRAPRQARRSLTGDNSYIKELL